VSSRRGAIALALAASALIHVAGLGLARRVRVYSLEDVYRETSVLFRLGQQVRLPEVAPQFVTAQPVEIDEVEVQQPQLRAEPPDALIPLPDDTFESRVGEMAAASRSYIATTVSTPEAVTGAADAARLDEELLFRPPSPDRRPVAMTSGILVTDLAAAASTPASVERLAPAAWESEAQDALAAERSSGDRRLMDAISTSALSLPVAGPRTLPLPEADGPVMESVGSRLEVPADALDDVLDADLRTWRSDGDGFFELTVTPKPDSERTAVVSRELVFVIDASRSMGDDVLEEIRRGVMECARRLGETDSFNIVAFSDLQRAAFRQETAPTREALTRASSFLRDLRAEGETDVYGALSRVVSAASRDEGPVDIILCSDGRSTSGETDPRAIIDGVSLQSGPNVSIHTLAAGPHAHEFLLDFLSYWNRGIFTSATRMTDVSSQLVGLLGEIRYPILRNVRADYANVDAADVYPKIYPGLYLGGSFRIYGRYDAPGAEVAVRLLGDVGGTTREMLLRKRLPEAEDGGRGIATAWARRRVEHLFGLGARRPLADEEEQEIQTLVRKYNIDVPPAWMQTEERR